jgi:pimeloyl-ACP methyl ester carboxylesterase
VALGAITGGLLLNRRLLGREARPAEAGAGRLVPTSEGDLHVVETGSPEAPAAVLLHGFAGSLHWFDRLAPLLAGDHRLVRIDALGHGGSAKPLAGYSVEQHATAATEALEHVGVEQALFVGHSFGAALSVAVAERDRALVERLVLIGEGPDNGFGDQPLMTRIGFVPVVGELLRRLAFDAAIRDGFRDAFAEGFDLATGFDDPDQVIHDYRAMTFRSYKGSWDGEEAYLAANRLDQRLRQLELPLLAIFGEHDSFFHADESAAAYRALPGARVEVLRGAGHSPNVERPDEVARLIHEFATVAAR